MGDSVRKKRKNQSGQAVVEYIVLLSIAVGLMAFFVKSLTSGIDKTIPRWGRGIEVQLRAGAAPASLWKK